MSSKKLIFLGMLMATVFSVSAWAQSNNFTMGQIMLGDRLVLQEPVEAPSKFWQISTLEKSFFTPNNARISKFEAVDRRNDGNNAYVTLEGGGVGYDFVKLKFKSKRNHGIHFMVNLYGR